METSIRLKDFSRIVFFTGAGISKESGVPTYRGAGGIWKTYDYETCACQTAFERDPEYVWEFHNYRRSLVGACAPNAGHEIIAQTAAAKSTTVITQNIDGLHQMAGSTEVVELHGSLWRVRCETCGIKQAGREAPLENLKHDCGTWWRPDITWFGDALNTTAIEAAEQALASCDLLVSVGTSAVVYPAAALPLIAQRTGATTVEINPEPTPMSDMYQHCLRGTASETLAVMAEGLA